MKSFSKAAVIGSVLMASSSAFALDMPHMPDMSGFYYHAQLIFTQVEITNSNGSGTATSPAVGLEVGTIVYENAVANVFLEAVLMAGLEDESAFTYSGGNQRYSGGMSGAVGLQAKFHRQFSGRFAGYLTLGALNITMDVTPESLNSGVWGASTVGPAADDTVTELTYALGAEYNVSDSSALTLSYGSLYSGIVGGSDVDVTSFNLGYKARF